MTTRDHRLACLLLLLLAAPLQAKEAPPTLAARTAPTLQQDAARLPAGAAAVGGLTRPTTGPTKAALPRFVDQTLDDDTVRPAPWRPLDDAAPPLPNRLDPLAELRRSGRGTPPSLVRGVDKDLPWSPDHMLADATHMNDAYASLAVSPVSGYLYCVFEAVDLGGTDRDIHIARSTDDGATWQVWELPSSSYDESMPEIAIDAAGYLHVVWLRADGYIVRTRSGAADDPTGWPGLHGFFTDSINATPAIAVSGAGDFAKVFITASYQEINWDLYQWEWTLVWMYSTNGGATVTWDALPPDGYPDLWPDCAVSGSTVHLVNAEVDMDSGLPRILLSTDSLSGSFAEITDLSAWTPNGCGFPRVACSGAHVYVVYQHDYDDGAGTIDGDIIYHRSVDGGATVDGPWELVADAYESVGPTVYARDGVVGALWLEAPPGADEFGVTGCQAGAYGAPEAWGELEVVSEATLAEPQFHFLDGAVGDGRLHAAWIDRRDTPTQGHNVYTSERTALPDLSPYAPAGWTSPLVASMIRGDRAAGYLAAGDTAWVSFALASDGLGDATGDFFLLLRVDDQPAQVWSVDGGLASGEWVAVEDHPLLLGTGTHRIEFVIDVGGAVAEADEADNTLAAEWSWIDGAPALAVYPGTLLHRAGEPSAAKSAALPTVRRHHLPALDPRLAADTAKAAPDGTLTVVVTPALRLDAAAALPLLETLDGDTRRETVAATQRDLLARSRTALSPLLDDLSRRGELHELRELWLAGALTARMTPQAAAELAAHPDVDRVWLDDRLSEFSAAPAVPSATAAADVPWHLARIGAPQAWAQGWNGDGVLVGHLDTGVSYDHPDLVGGMWDGGAAYPHHGWDAVDDDDDPYEGDPTMNHGTHTAGLVVGDGSGGTPTGAAPGAALMALRAVPGYYADLIEAMQFGLDHGPVDLFTMSAGWSLAGDALREANRANAEILLAMGIPWFCAGGNGDNAGGHYAPPNDINTPGDCPGPVYGDGGHGAVISVGALTSADVPWSLSSVGPAAWELSGTPYVDYPLPAGLIKPDLAAPGDAVLSTYGNNAYIAYSGTSMATPLAAAAAAVLKQYSPGATPEHLAAALEASAVDLMTPGRDNQVGAGLIDLPAALAIIPHLGGESLRLVNVGDLPLVLEPAQWTATWLAVSPRSGVIAPGDTLLLGAVFDTTGLGTGIYADELVLTSNDPDGPHRVQVILTVGDYTGVENRPPAAAARLVNWPNPFNPRTTVRFEVPRGGRVVVEVLDLRGRRVRTLLDAELPPGPHEAVWDGADDGGRPGASGVYQMRLRLPDGATAVRKVSLIR